MKKILEHVPYNVPRPLYLIAAKARPQKKSQETTVTLPVTYGNRDGPAYFFTDLSMISKRLDRTNN